MEFDGGFVKQRKELERLMMTDPSMEKRVQNIIRDTLKAVRSVVSSDAASSMKTDPRQAYKAVRTSVYRRILGGNVNILAKRHASRTGGAYTPPRTLQEGQRGGNRRKRSERTEQIDSYWGGDRGFILRFVNAGTNGRDTRYGNRGSISPRNFFGSSSQSAMEQAADTIGMLIDELIEKQLNA